MHGAARLRHTLLSVVMLASLALALDGDSARMQSLTTKVFCNCGCGEVLAQCSHLECKTRYRTTAARLNVSLGSLQYQAINLSMAKA
jgi:hypothetical protein